MKRKFSEEIEMDGSNNRILTTHVGSLPRPVKLIQMMFAKEEGEHVDQSALSSSIAEAVREVVNKQLNAGIDIVNDGEASKPSYATYIKDRLSGFGGEGNSFVYQDVADFPDMAKRVFNDPGRSRRKTPGCNSDISVIDPGAAATDVVNLKEAIERKSLSNTFLTAASPGVISLFFANSYYPDFESYIFAIADAMREEYRTITEAGITLQLDCPDLAMGRHIQYADLSLKEFRKRAEIHVEALNYALGKIPKSLVRLHLCWGNYEGPHHCDVPLSDIIDIALRANASAFSFEAANPRHAHEYKIFDDVKIPEDVVLIPGVIESKSNFIEHPELVAQRILRLAKRVGRERVIAGSDCGYGTWVGQAAVEPEIVWAKLATLCEGARRATTELWDRSS